MNADIPPLGSPNQDDSETDFVHPFGEHADWNESFYFNAYDKEKDICTFMRIGLKPNRREKTMFCFFIMPDGSVIGARGEEELHDTSFRAKGLVFERIRPEKEWRLTFNGPMRRSLANDIKRMNVSFDLTYRSINKTFDYRESASNEEDIVTQVAATEHTEQFGKLQGFANIGGEQIKISGLGERDHSWGVRDWLAPTMWIWLSGQFSERHAFNITKLIIGKDVVDAGYVHIDGVNKPIVKIDLNTEYRKGGGPKSLKAWLMEKSGDVHEIDGLVMRTAMLPFSGTIDKNVSTLYETLAKFTSGDEVGFGVAEYLMRDY
jgi:hypothetical protein